MSELSYVCNCGFTWDHGQSGTHRCSEGYRKQIATLKAERDDWREQAQRNDTPVKSAAEIGRDAILEASNVIRGGDDWHTTMNRVRSHANNLTANSGVNNG